MVIQTMFWLPIEINFLSHVLNTELNVMLFKPWPDQQTKFVIQAIGHVTYQSNTLMT